MTSRFRTSEFVWCSCINKASKRKKKNRPYAKTHFLTNWIKAIQLTTALANCRCKTSCGLQLVNCSRRFVLKMILLLCSDFKNIGAAICTTPLIKSSTYKASSFESFSLHFQFRSCFHASMISVAIVHFGTSELKIWYIVQICLYTITTPVPPSLSRYLQQTSRSSARMKKKKQLL